MSKVVSDINPNELKGGAGFKKFDEYYPTLLTSLFDLYDNALPPPALITPSFSFFCNEDYDIIELRKRLSIKIIIKIEVNNELYILLFL